MSNQPSPSLSPSISPSLTGRGSAFDSQLPFQSCVLQPRSLVFEQGIAPLDLLQLQHIELPPASQMHKRSSSHKFSHDGRLINTSLSSHPIHSLTTPATPTVSHQARLEPIHQALVNCNREQGRPTTSLTYNNWLKQASLFFNATPSHAKLYWQLFLAVHRSSHSPPFIPSVDRNGIPIINSPTAATTASNTNRYTQTITLPTTHLEVDLQEFMLFLFVQRFQGYRLAKLREFRSAAATAATAAAASGASVPASSSNPPTPVELQKGFLVQNMRDILNWCRDADRHDALPATGLQPSSLSAREFNRISFLIQGLAHPHDSVELKSLHRLTAFFTSPQALKHEGARKPNTPAYAVPIDTLSSWICSQLQRPVLGVSIGLSLSLSSDDFSLLSGEEQDGPSQVESLALLPVADVRQISEKSLFFRRPAEGEELPPTSPTYQGSSFSFSSSNLSASGSAGSPADRCLATGSFVHIHHSNNSSFHLQLVSRFISVTHLNNCNLNLGVVTHQVQIKHCRNCVIWLVLPHAQAGLGCNLQLAYCQNIKIYLYTNGVLQVLNSTPETKDPDGLGAFVLDQPAIGSSSSVSGSAGALGTASTATTNSGSHSHSNSTTMMFDEEDDPLSPNNASITLAPYNTFYSELNHDLKTVGLQLENFTTNTFDKFATLDPILLPAPVTGGSANNSRAPSPVPGSAEAGKVVASAGRKGKATLALAHSSSASLLPIQLTFPQLPLSITVPVSAKESVGDVSLLPWNEFFPVAQPGLVSESQLAKDQSKTQATTANPFPLPKDYQHALVERERQARRNRSLIDAAKLTPSQQHSFQSLMASEFQTWLTLTYSKSFVNNLVRADEEHLKILHFQQQQRLQQAQRANNATLRTQAQLTTSAATTNLNKSTVVAATAPSAKQ